MKCIFINPVVDAMYPPKKLNPILKELGYERVYIEENWGQIVKEKYRDVTNNSKKTVVDMRCPMAVDLVMEITKPDTLIFPEIEPILLHCAREISEREALLGVEKWITTPCKRLADMGNGLGLQDTQFISWKDFLEMEQMELEMPKIPMTPIPLGYFGELPVQVKSLSTKEDITRYFLEEDVAKMKLIELLYCKEGCHKGDGVLE